MANYDVAEKIRENSARRAADRQGLVLRKSRRKDSRAVGYGTWGLYDHHGTLAAGDAKTGYGLTLKQVEDRLARR
jgi:hypothetical protein